MSNSNIEILRHPLIQHRLTLLRDKDTDSGNFRNLLSDLSLFMTYEALSGLSVYDMDVETPLAVKTKSSMIRSSELAFISIMRAGNGMLEGALKLVPSAHFGHIGLYRDPQTFTAIEYYFKLPVDMANKHAIAVDPMLATGHTAVAAITRIKETQPKSIIFVCAVASPEGIACMQETHPDTKIYTAAIDVELNEQKYIIPGLGDAGDRMYGTI